MTYFLSGFLMGLPLVALAIALCDLRQARLAGALAWAVADTIRAHGYAWAEWYFTANRRGPQVPHQAFRALARHAS